MKKYFFYIPEGPTISDTELVSALEELITYAKSAGAFALRIGPMLIRATWEADLIKSALADEGKRTLNQISPTFVNPDAIALERALSRLNFRRSNNDSAGFGSGQPKFLYQLPLKNKNREKILAEFNQLWRRNIKKSESAGVEVRIGFRDDLVEFHRIYSETAVRDNFTARPLNYFYTMWDAFNSDDTEPNILLFLARWNNENIAAAIYVELGLHGWYLYGASTLNGREVRPSNALQWAMMERALAKGSNTYDLRGITATVDKKNPHVGLLQFKVGVGGRAVEVMGEWDYPFSPLLYRAFRAYLKRR